MTVVDLYGRLLDAWNRRDAAGYAALFAADGTVIGFDGSLMTAGEIGPELAAIFADHPTASYVAKVREVRSLGPDAVLLRAIVGMLPPGGDRVNAAANAHHVLIAQRYGDQWRIVLFQNTPAQFHGRPQLVEEHTAELRDLPAGTVVATE